MKRRIDSLINKNGYTGYYDYLNVIKVNTDLRNEFINFLTINVSEFYRNPEQWKILENDVLPKLLSENMNLKIWSSACSTGEEPYTLVMVLSKLIPIERINVIATDIDEQAIEKAKKGLYIKKSVFNLPKDLITKYFIVEKDFYKISDAVKRRVSFKKLDLLKDNYPKGLDLILCRNVIIYFTNEAKDEVYKKFSDSLREKGILFVGSTEQIISSYNFGLEPMKTFFYLKNEKVRSLSRI